MLWTGDSAGHDTPIQGAILAQPPTPITTSVGRSHFKRLPCRNSHPAEPTAILVASSVNLLLGDTEGSVYVPLIADRFRTDCRLRVLVVLLFRNELHAITVIWVSEDMFRQGLRIAQRRSQCLHSISPDRYSLPISERTPSMWN